MGWEGQSFLQEGKKDEITRVNNEKGNVSALRSAFGLQALFTGPAGV